MENTYQVSSPRGFTASSLLVTSCVSAAVIWMTFFATTVQSAVEPTELSMNTTVQSLNNEVPTEVVQLESLTSLNDDQNDDEALAALIELTPIEMALQSGEVITVTEREIKRGETLSALWGEHDLPLNGAVSAQKALRESGVKTLQLGERVKIGLDARGDIVALERKLSPIQSVILRGDSHTGYQASFWAPETQARRTRAEGTIQSTLAESALQVGVPYEVIDEFVDLLSDRVDFRREIQPGAKFVVIFEETLNSLGKRLSTGTVHAVMLRNNNKEYAGLRWLSPEGKVLNFNEKGEPTGNFFLRYPLSFTRISSVFSHSRFHPVLKKGRPHNGVDFAAPVGTPIRSVADGVIEVATYNRAAGNMVKIRHSPRYQTEYFHLSRFASGMKKGTRVTRGQVIGYVGSTGLSTGPHLHFGMFRDGRYVDPMKVELPRMPIDGMKIPENTRRALLRELRGRRVQVARARNAEVDKA